MLLKTKKNIVIFSIIFLIIVLYLVIYLVTRNKKYRKNIEKNHKPENYDLQCTDLLKLKEKVKKVKKVEKVESPIPNIFKLQENPIPTPTTSPIPDSLKQDLDKFIPQFNKKFKYILGSKLNDIVKNNKTTFRAIFNVFCGLIKMDYGNIMSNIITYLISNHYTQNPDYIVNEVKNIDCINFTLVNNDIEYLCEGGKSYIKLNLNMSTYEKDSDKNLIIDIALQLYIYLRLQLIDIPLGVRIDLPATLKIEVLKNVQDGTMSLNLNNYDLQLSFTGDAYAKMFASFCQYFWIYKVAQIPNNLLYIWFANLFKGKTLIENVLIPGLFNIYQYTVSSLQDVSFEMIYGIIGGFLRNLLGTRYNILLDSNEDDPYRYRAMGFDESDPYIDFDIHIGNLSNKRLLERQKNKEIIENFDGAKWFKDIRNMCKNYHVNRSWTMRIMCYGLLDSTTILSSIVKAIKAKQFSNASSQLGNILIIEAIWFVVLSFFACVSILAVIVTGLAFSSSQKDDPKNSNIFYTSFTCNYCTYNNQNCQSSTVLPKPTRDPKCPPCASDTNDIVMDSVVEYLQDIYQHLDFSRFRSLEESSNQYLDQNCVPDCSGQYCGESDGCGNLCFMKFMNQIYNPRVTWVMGDINNNKKINYNIDPKTINNEIKVLISTDNDTSKNISYICSPDNEVMVYIYQGYDFIKTYDVFYFDFAINMYRNSVNEDIIIYPINCNDSCLTFQRDINNCGSCGNKCQDCEECCAGKCVDFNTSNENCGECGNICPANTYCCDGRCLENRGSDCQCVAGWSGEDCDQKL